MRSILIVVTIFFYQTVFSQQTQLFSLRLLLPDTVSRSNLPDSFAIEIMKLVEGNLKISSPEFVNNLKIELLENNDTVIFYSIHSPVYYMGYLLEINSNELVWYKASHVIRYLKEGTYLLLPIYVGLIYYNNSEIPYSFVDNRKGKYCLCEPKKIVVIE